MPSLKEFRNRIASVKSTRKITSAMKMVAASKLRKAEAKAEQGREYLRRMNKMIANLTSDLKFDENYHPLLLGTGKEDVHLFVVLTSDNGLCGSFNSSVTRLAARKINELLLQGKEVKVITLGRKGGVFFRREYPKLLIKSVDNFGHKDVSFKDASELFQEIQKMFSNKEFDVFNIVYNEFKSVMVQKPITKKLIPFDMSLLLNSKADKDEEISEVNACKSLYTFEPSKEDIFTKLVPLNLSLQIFKAFIDNSAGEKAARMTAMDSATNNANAMINNLTLRYNRARQAYITKELIEIISGAEAV